MKKKNLNIIYSILVLFLSLPLTSYAQDKTITGTVVSASDNLPLPGASIAIKGTSTGTITDIDGSYTLDANTGDILVFSYVHFKRQMMWLTISSVALGCASFLIFEARRA